jgi:hypothetical protein
LRDKYQEKTDILLSWIMHVSIMLRSQKMGWLLYSLELRLWQMGY